MLDEAVVTENIARLAARLSERTGELTGDLVVLYARELPNLVHDDESVVSLLSASLYQNIDTALRIFQHGIDPARVEAPAAAMEYARRLAQRGIPVIDLIRAYYLGQTAILNHAVAAAPELIPDPLLLGAVLGRALTITFTFIDRVTQQVVSAYQEERDRWLLNRSAMRAARVRALLEGGGAELDATEAAIGYRLRGTHLAMIVWHGLDPAHGNALGSLELVAGEIAAALPTAGEPLFVPVDELCAWVWFPLSAPALPGEEHVERVLGKADPAVRLVLGEPGEGVDGFRRSHRQAVRVHALATAAGEHCGRVLTFRDVGAIALMTSDLAAARTWVAETLGELATGDEQHERLRETLRVFLATGGSYTAAAGRLTMHKNSVQYRVRKAEEILGRPVAESRLDIELALKLCHRLGGAVLLTR
ncbi:ABC transporter substrate-binding protein [Amycolatopsis rhizosphaerae]|uniref:ABC transporter substrate-binding protein n=1 Tax=Amycolatopsis rhizosphaerae TaxID=2053003 RepID=A0A558DEB7_9PSEU|nr:helix-turn-helix domain-containing protein [Amycolatopsis rhizosphaerae]TVT59360.1 ABC transporter substrate-binding protein [Amycolatopsis rhizosphaerae]